MLVNTRYSLGFYASRFYALIATIVVLLLFFCETTILYAVLAQTMIRQRRERESRQVAMDSMAAAIAHELKQPLAAISAYGYAAMRWMEKPDFDEMRVSIKCMISNAHHASEVIDGIRSLFKKDTRGRAWLDVNELVRQVLRTVDAHLRTQRVSVSTELREGLPQLFANRVQLEEMFVNLIMNAIEAMNSVTDRARLLRISSDIIHEPSSVQVTVEDAGMGLGKDKERIFEAFYTTKSEGTGIGLAICRAIVETHGGSLHASANKPYGTIFHVALPTGGGVRAPVPGTAHG
jgi:signal transduction histidine kinase